MGQKALTPILELLFNQILVSKIVPKSWKLGLTHILYKGKGDKTHLKNYRGITVNNSISKVFTTILNDRLYKTIEEANILGQIQFGGRKNKRPEDALFILRTIIEKGAKSHKKTEDNLSLLFIDLTKAYDSVPHDRLWGKLIELGIGEHFVDILKALYKDTSVKIIINGCETDTVYMRRGIKQGCVLSPLLFILYVSGLAQMLETHSAGMTLMDIIITALFYVDDLILIAKTEEKLKALLKQVQNYLDHLGLAINVSKTKILSQKEGASMSLTQQVECEMGIIENAQMYKYLGVTLSTGSAAAAFSDYRQKLPGRLRSYAWKISSMSKESFAPFTVAKKMWNSVAIPAVFVRLEFPREEADF
jgi:hypothetical protein